MAGKVSPYYPPRARWHSPLRHFWADVRYRITGLRDIIPSPLGLRATIWSLLIPGFVLRAFGYRTLGKYAMILCGLALLIFFVWLGYPIATIAFAIILALHVTSIAFLLKRFTPNLHWLLRIASTLIVLIILNNFVYGFFQSKLEDATMPLRIKSNIVIVNAISRGNLTRGDWVAYRIERNSVRVERANLHGNIVVEAGYGLERLMAGPGDVIRFKEGSFQINNQHFRGRPYLPTQGEIILSENQWLVWPKFAIRGNGIPENEIARFLQGYAVISNDQIIGKPFKRWFGRKQILQ